MVTNFSGRTAIVSAVLSSSVLIAGCSTNPSSPPGPTGAMTGQSAVTSAAAPGAAPMKIHDPYQPVIDPAAFSTTIDNPYLPMTPGTRTIYEADTSDGHQQTTTEVTGDTKKIMGVTTVVVHDTVTLDGKTSEDTLDWFAQDRDGNVWYFGESTKEFDGQKVSTAGSFEAGVDGALPGIVMPAHPQIGDQYRQEYAKGVAEDTGEVVSLTGSDTTPLTGPAKDLLVIKDADLLDPNGPAENKYYARGIGLILTVPIPGAPDRDQAIRVEKF